jgi:hypothetical protein
MPTIQDQKKLIIQSLIWVKENIEVNKCKLIIEKNTPITQEEKISGYKRYCKEKKGDQENKRMLIFKRFTLCWDAVMGKTFTLPHRGTYKNISVRVKALMRYLIHNLFNNMKKEKGQPLLKIQPVINKKEEKKGLGEDCPICCNEMNENTSITTSCGHTYCYKCISKWVKNKSNCPICRKNIVILIKKKKN